MSSRAITVVLGLCAAAATACGEAPESTLPSAPTSPAQIAIVQPSTPMSPPASPPAPTRWGNTYGEAADELAYGVATDGNGNAFVTGSFQGTLDLGCGALTAAGASDLFVAKYGSGGACVWSVRFGVTGNTVGMGIAAGTDGGVFVTGTFDQTTNLGGGVIATMGGLDGFVLALSTSGTYVWANQVGGGGDDIPVGIAYVAAPLGGGAASLAVAGSFYGTASFGGMGLTSAGDSDAFVAKFDAAAGAHLWSLAIGGPTYDAANAVAANATQVVVTGPFSTTMPLGSGTLTSAGNLDAFVASFDASGVYQWSAQVGGAGAESANGVALGADGETYVTGYFQQAASIGASPSLTGAGQYSTFLARFDATGSVAWSAVADGTDTVVPEAIAFDASGSVVLSGYFAGSLTAGGTQAAGILNGYFMQYRTDGTPVATATKTYGLAGGAIAMAVATSGLGDAVVAGYFDTSIDVGGGARPSAGGNDVFAVSLSLQ